ncbi:type 1 glutamine amidotransferase [Nocardioides houyundeii]|uniref:type 1 glutamine amidotransferase n=1 Tax=Nocardioides houyundeii TaxID=2045452 RepID=UPI000C7896EE|nr:type 1 glutamine amidotransferase [Nocardioides houyundeii]
MRSPRVLVVEHHAECPPALLGEWLVEAGCELELCRPWSGDALPEAGAYDGVLVLGGEMGANDDERHWWLTGVKELVRAAGEAGVPTLGICLGHQLMAVALGGRVERNPDGQTIGLQIVGWQEAASRDVLAGSLGATARGVHWNSDVVTELPPGAKVLARTEDGAPQVVRYAERAWGLQLHPEADEHVVAPWAEGDRADHLARGIDSEQVLAEIAAARDELAATWRPLARSFAAILLARASEVGVGG